MVSPQTEVKFPFETIPTTWHPVLLAAENNHTAVCRVLLEFQGVDLTAQLFPTALQQDLRLRERFLNYVRDHYALDRPVSFGLNALHWAALRKNKELCQLFLEHGAEVDSTTLLDGRTALSIASCVGSVDCIRILVVAGASINEPDLAPPGRWHPIQISIPTLFHAVTLNQVEACKVLKDLGAFLPPVTEESDDLLMLCMDSDAAETAEWLLGQLEEDERALALKCVSRGRPLLGWAAVKGHTKLCRLLLDVGGDFIDLEGRDSNGLTPLALAGARNHLDTFKFLLERGADILSRDYDGDTILAAAVENDALQTVKVIIDLGLASELNVSKDVTPAAKAVGLGLKDIAESLIRAGISLENQNKRGDSLLDYAIAKEQNDLLTLMLDLHPEAVDLLDGDQCPPLSVAASQHKMDAFYLLLHRNAKVDWVCPEGATGKPGDGFVWTPLCKAVLYDNLEAVMVLLDRGASMSSSTNAGYPYLLQAAGRASVNMCRLLVERGCPIADTVPGHERNALHVACGGDKDETAEYLADVYIQKGYGLEMVDSEGRTALHFAADDGRSNIVKMLIKKNARPDVRDNRGQTAADLAEANGHKSLARHLRSMKAKNLFS
ncbi:hypothetical protein HDU96_009005 [Phlyctochytrium bullatum]|nr:hypothetical protein HDU96_009005 [Phlyctochytrium bullatum]